MTRPAACCWCASEAHVDVTGEIIPNREIDEAIWIDPAAPPDIDLAPLTRDHVLPLASATRAAADVR
jgi:hypothetical protein